MSSRPISLLLICHWYPPVWGGSELEAQRVCAALIRSAGRWKGAVKDTFFALQVAGMLLWERRNYQLLYSRRIVLDNYSTARIAARYEALLGEMLAAKKVAET